MSNQKGGELEERGLECLTAMAENLKSRGELEEHKSLNV